MADQSGFRYLTKNSDLQMPVKRFSATNKIYKFDIFQRTFPLPRRPSNIFLHKNTTLVVKCTPNPLYIHTATFLVKLSLTSIFNQNNKTNNCSLTVTDEMLHANFTT